MTQRNFKMLQKINFIYQHQKTEDNKKGKLEFREFYRKW